MEGNQEQVTLDDSNRKKIEKYEEELNNVRIDFERLKVEKKESDLAGKNFMERYSTYSMHSALQYSRFQLLWLLCVTIHITHIFVFNINIM